MKYTYSAILTPQGNGEYMVEVPALPGCISYGDTLTDALVMIADAASMWLWDAENKGEPIPKDQPITAEASCHINYVVADTGEYRRQHDSRAVKKTLTIPSWLNFEAEKAGINFSSTLQDALRDRLGIVE